MQLSEQDRVWIDTHLVAPAVEAIVAKLKPYILTIGLLFFVLVGLVTAAIVKLYVKK